MSRILIAASAALALAAPVVALAATPAPPKKTAPKARFTIDTAIGDLVENPEAKKVVEKRFPGLIGSNHYAMLEDMSIRQLVPMSQGKLTPEVLAKINAELAAIR